MSNTLSVTINPDDNGWMTATGKLPVPFTNDFLFCAMLQKNNLVLKSLICSLMHLSPEEVHSVDITNPIELGDKLEEKAIVLDIKLILNNHTIIDLEMQVVNEHNWPERSLLYLCRTFSQQLKKGEDYITAKPAGKADIRNPLSLLAHERSRFATCQWELLTPTDISIPLPTA